MPVKAAPWWPLSRRCLAASRPAPPGRRRRRHVPSEQDIFGGAAPKPRRARRRRAGRAAPRGGTAGAPPAARSPSRCAAAAPAANRRPRQPSPASMPTPRDRRDQDAAGRRPGEPQHLQRLQAPDNPLQIGGQLYLRAQTTAPARPRIDQHWSLSAPSLLDVYLDARPNPRVRAFVLGRMSYDPTRAAQRRRDHHATAAGKAPSPAPRRPASRPFNDRRGPNSLLDQMWIRFDIDHTVFVTAGKQHVRWGTGRFWQPTDYLHPLKRNPLDVFDARAGTTMLKLHVPWEDARLELLRLRASPRIRTTRPSTPQAGRGRRRAPRSSSSAPSSASTRSFKRGQKPRVRRRPFDGHRRLRRLRRLGIRAARTSVVVHAADGSVRRRVASPCPARRGRLRRFRHDHAAATYDVTSSPA